MCLALIEMRRLSASGVTAPSANQDECPAQVTPSAPITPPPAAAASGSCHTLEHWPSGSEAARIAELAGAALHPHMAPLLIDAVGCLRRDDGWRAAALLHVLLESTLRRAYVTANRLDAALCLADTTRLHLTMETILSATVSGRDRPAFRSHPPPFTTCTPRPSSIARRFRVTLRQWMERCCRTSCCISWRRVSSVRSSMRCMLRTRGFRIAQHVLR